MKKFLVIFLLLLCYSYSHAEPQEVFSRTFMYTRPAYWNLAMNQSLWHNFSYFKDGPNYNGMQLIPFFQDSRSRRKNTLFFLFNRRSELLIAGDASDAVRTRDVRAEWVKLPTDFKGKMTLRPEQRQIGATFEYSQDFKTLFPESFLKDWTVNVVMPLTLVENDINFSQYDMHTTGTELNRHQTIHAAFNDCSWCYAKIPTKKQDLIRPGQLKVTMGSAYLHHEKFFQMSYYSGLVIPLTNHADPEFLFSPMPGNNRHAGLVAGIATQVLLNRHPEKFAWSFYVELEGTFLIRNKQMRTYDLKEKPWSRYMQYVRKNSAPGDTIPGVNLLTFPTLVRPFGVADFSFGWRINTGAFEFEIGYDLWGHGGERVKLRTQDVESPFNRCGGGENLFGIAGRGSYMDKGIQLAATASNSTIACQAADDTAFTPITENDIDLCSAQNGSALNHKVHGSVGIQHLGDQTQGFLGFGFYFDFAQKNTTLTTYGVWFKLGGTF